MGRALSELAILATAREHDQPYEWSLHEMEAIAVGFDPAVIDVVRNREPLTAPAAGPNSNAVVNVKTSEMEKLIGTAGIRSIRCPLTTVRTASATHRRSGGTAMICHTDALRTSIPTVITVQRKIDPAFGSRFFHARERTAVDSI